MEQGTIDFEAEAKRRADAIAARDDGMQRAIDHANEDAPGWGELAFQNLCMYLRYVAPDAFMGEDVRAYATAHGLPDPPDKRAWGAVMVKAAKRGMIRKIGYAHAKDPKVHLSINPLWEKA